MITAIPGDCIMDILSYLEETDLYEMSYLNHRMFELVQIQLVRNREQHPGELRIVESEYGHAFTLHYEDTDKYYAYTLSDCPWGGNPTQKRFQFSQKDEPTHEHLLLFRKHYVTKFKPVPSLLLSNLDQLLQKHSFNFLTFYNILIDKSFLSYLEKLVYKLNHVNIWGVKVEEDCIERLIKFIWKFKPWDITITNSESAFKAFMNESSFETYFLESNWDEKLVIKFDIPEYFTDKYRFYPSKAATLQYLSTLIQIEHLSLTIDPQWIPELLEKRLKSEELFCIVVALAEMPAQWNFDEFPHLEFGEGKGAKFDKSHHTPSHAVLDTENGRSISFAAYNEGNVIAFRACYNIIN